jgi:hypothetical protein
MTDVCKTKHLIDHIPDARGHTGLSYPARSLKPGNRQHIYGPEFQYERPDRTLYQRGETAERGASVPSREQFTEDYQHRMLLFEYVSLLQDQNHVASRRHFKLDSEAV